MSTPALVKAYAPELESVDDDEFLEIWLPAAARRMGEYTWGRVYGDAQAYLAAHLKIVQLRGKPSDPAAPPEAGEGVLGPKESVGVGRWNTKYGGNLSGTETGIDAGSDSSLITTRQGKIYLELRRSRIAGRVRQVKPGLGSRGGRYARRYRYR